MLGFRLTVTVTALLVMGLAEQLQGHDWRWYTPSLKSEVQKLGVSEANSLLGGFCAGPVRVVPKIGPECATRELGARFADIVEHQFHPQGMIKGHFLAPNSEDLAVNGWSAETHPFRWGGTLLLTKRDGLWKPLWYKSGLITHSCEKAPLNTGREILLCEDEDGGMGHMLHDLYAVDLMRPAEQRESILAEAESSNDGCMKQRQVMDPMVWAEDRSGFSVTTRTLEWHGMLQPTCKGMATKRPARLAQLLFVVGDDGVHRMP